jgi:EmrB/QacA subfamily drug resistance transporter
MSQVVLSSARGHWIILATVLGSSMAGVDATVVNIALPAIGRDMHVPFASLQWTITAYTVTLAGLILLGGSLGDQFGRRRLFLIGVAWFTAASACCALAPSIGWLIAARALQGAGAALLTPASLAILQAEFVPADRPRAIGAWAAFSGIATAIAPFIGGWLLAVGSWRWSFLINLPLAAAVAVIAVHHIPETRSETAVAYLDWRGACAAVIALGGITQALINVSSRSASSPYVTVPGAVGLVALAGFVALEARQRQPMLPLELFQSAQFSAVNTVTFLLYGAFGGFLFLLVVALQVGSGYSPLVAGSALLPITALTLLLAERSGQLAQRIGPRRQMSVGPLTCAGGVLLGLRIGRHADYLADVLPCVALFGLGLAILVAPLTATALSSASPERAGIASGVNNTVARAGSLIAVAALPGVIGITGHGYTQPPRFIAGFHIAVWICSAILIAGAALAASLISNTTSAPVHEAAPPLARSFTATPTCTGPAGNATGRAQLRQAQVNRPHARDREIYCPVTHHGHDADPLDHGVAVRPLPRGSGRPAHRLRPSNRRAGIRSRSPPEPGCGDPVLGAIDRTVNASTSEEQHLGPVGRQQRSPRTSAQLIDRAVQAQARLTSGCAQRLSG